ncbi:MAG: DEAD/DEAH box helicase, partial [Lewinella sp.]|nr:DEAD/DEAH box helicase [Lewinella sp.]
PTGSGKTYSLVVPILLEGLQHQQEAEGKADQELNTGLRAIWLTPIRALAREIQQSAQRAATGLGLNWTIGIRTGDTSSSERTQQAKRPPQFLITTPESLQLFWPAKTANAGLSNSKS